MPWMDVRDGVKLHISFLKKFHFLTFHAKTHVLFNLFQKLLTQKGHPYVFFFKSYIKGIIFPRPVYHACIFKSGLHTWMEFYLINLTSVAYYIWFNIFIITKFKWRHVMKKLISLAPIACSVSENAICMASGKMYCLTEG